MQQVLASLTNRAGLKAATVTRKTPLSSSSMTGSAAFVPGSAVTVAERAAFLSSTEAGIAASVSTAVAFMTHLDEGRVRHSDLLHLVGVSLRKHHLNVPRRRTGSILRSVYRLTVVGLKLPGAGSGLSVGLQSVPVHSDGFELFERQVPGWFGAVPPLRLHKLEKSVSGHIL